MKRLKDIEDPLERFDERYERSIKIEAIREKKRKQSRNIKIFVGLLIVLYGLYAIFSQ